MLTKTAPNAIIPGVASWRPNLIVMDLRSAPAFSSSSDEGPNRKTFNN